VLAMARMSPKWMPTETCASSQKFSQRRTEPMKRIKLILSAAVVLLGTACAGGGLRHAETAEQAIARRATERWDFLIAKKPEAAWAYLTPGYRDTHDEDSYNTSMRNRPVRWEKVTFKSVECDAAETSCLARLSVDFRVRSSLGMVGEISAQKEIGERWLKLDGSWFVLPED